jgi:hypothetical protein
MFSSAVGAFPPTFQVETNILLTKVESNESDLLALKGMGKW